MIASYRNIQKLIARNSKYTLPEAEEQSQDRSIVRHGRTSLDELGHDVSEMEDLSSCSPHNHLVESQGCLLFQRIIEGSFLGIERTLYDLNSSTGQIYDWSAIFGMTR